MRMRPPHHHRTPRPASPRLKLCQVHLPPQSSTTSDFTSSNSNSSGRPHESQLTPTAPTPRHRPPLNRRTYKKQLKARGRAPASAPRILSPPAQPHRRRSTSHHVPQEADGGPGAGRGLHRLFQPYVLPLPPPPRPARAGAGAEGKRLAAAQQRRGRRRRSRGEVLEEGAGAGGGDQEAELVARPG